MYFSIGWHRSLEHTYMIDLWDRSSMIVFHVGKSATVFGFHRFLPSYFVFMCRNQSFYPALWTTRIEDTSYTNGYSILGKDRQLFTNLCHYRHMRKKLPSFHFCIICSKSLSLWNCAVNNKTNLKLLLQKTRKQKDTIDIHNEI